MGYRGKRKDNNEWIDGDLVHEPYGIYIYTFEDGICIKYEVKEETVCQYKKIVDKNGKLLCDNDIALYHNEEDGTGIGIIRDDYVEWISGTIAMSHLITPLFYLQCSSEWEIVGNTFDDKNYISQEE